MVAVPADGQFARIAAMGLVRNSEIFVKTPGAHSNILSRKNLSIEPIYRCIEAEAKHEKEFDGSANNRGGIANRPYMDNWLTRHPYIGSVTETSTRCIAGFCKGQIPNGSDHGLSREPWPKKGHSGNPAIIEASLSREPSRSNTNGDGHGIDTSSVGSSELRWDRMGNGTAMNSTTGRKKNPGRERSTACTGTTATLQWEVPEGRLDTMRVVQVQTRKVSDMCQLEGGRRSAPNSNIRVISWTVFYARRRCCLTIIRVQIMSGFKLAHRREMVSQPPDKMRSTATADPMEIISASQREERKNDVPGIV
ncbi:hypothetical protein DFH08DRAFT_818787 [Mycena albidolilacea]|uniref:Uncharacterized protein n=1 Tax=Mycena albidolilacea TaxID=1033008 RepID=A0AAD6ZG89_9AGAR|nr:hypothetical protein DFH08DRAFT_818787 [Mycena albidolilacea]